jgi:hypothetical protein
LASDAGSFDGEFRPGAFAGGLGAAATGWAGAGAAGLHALQQRLGTGRLLLEPGNLRA